jgi:hypothetical protein
MYKKIIMPKFNHGDRIVCILNNRASLTVGKEYVVLKDDYDDGDDLEILIINDAGHDTWYSSERFVSSQHFRDLKLRQLQIITKETEDDNS